MIKKILLSLSVLMLVWGCSSDNTGTTYPKSPKDARRERQGKVTGEGGLNLLGFGSGGENSSGGNVGIGVNSYLWQASLDTISFMPLASADPFGGVIITDWYEDPSVKGERFKLNIVILGKELRVDGLRVSVFKQVADAKTGWRDVSVDAKTGRDIEDKILTRARQLRVVE